MRQFPLSIRALLLASLGLTAGRAITLPVIAVYLSRVLALEPSAVGYILGASLTLGTLSSLYGGYVVDRADRRLLLVGGTLACALSYFVFPGVGSAWAALLLLTVSYATASLLDITVKAYIAQLVTAEVRVKVFSVRYTLNNIGFAVGPLLGAYLAIHSERVLFHVSGAVAILSLLPLFVVWGQLADKRARDDLAPVRSFADTLHALRNDDRLVKFTLAGMLAAVVYARFSAYLSQYLAVVVSAEVAYRTVAYVITVNAVVVIAFQYLIGSRITVDNLHRWIAAGLLLFALGLFGFLSATALPIWLVAMVVFSIGEVIVIPAGYLFIDAIAPEDMKGSYFGVQSLGNLGGAASPVLCGLMLSGGHPAAMFWVLIAITALALWLFHIGHRAGHAHPAVSVPTP
ncbi:MFS transporter [Chitinimonas naiadis]